MKSDVSKLNMLKAPYEEKLKWTKQLILEWYLQYKGQVYVSFSGGKDSTVLLDIVRSVKGCENVPAVFVDTGLEYPEIRDFVKTKENVIWIKPKLNFKQVIEKYGYPIISKEQSSYIQEYRTTKSEKLRNLRLNGRGGNSFKIAEKWKPLLSCDFKISDKCCDIMKKTPDHLFRKQTGRKGITGVMADESRLRHQKFLHTNCNAFKQKYPQSTPLMFWTEQDIFRYISENQVKIASVYGDVVKDENGLWKTTGAKRTGCMFCMFGLHLEGSPNRFDRMKETHPKQYDYIMNKLNGRHVMDCYLKCDGKE